MINKKTPSFNEFKEMMRIKRIKNKEYLYISIPGYFQNKTKEKYLGRYTEDENQLFYYYTKLILSNFLDALDQIRNTKYQGDYIDITVMRGLDLFSLAHSISLKDFTPTDVIRYQDAKYTEYVQGTTEIEGNTYSLVETELTLNQGLTVNGKTTREFYEIDNYASWKRYLTRIQKNTSFIHPLKINSILKIHELLLQKIDDGAGILRNIPVAIRGSKYTPPPPVVIEIELLELINWYNENIDKIYPIELIAIFHQRFEQIHPFRDGNGRVGREIMRLQLHEFNFPTLFISKKNRLQYLEALESGNEGNYQLIVNFVISGIFHEFMSEVHAMISFLRDSIYQNTGNENNLESIDQLIQDIEIELDKTTFSSKMKTIGLDEKDLVAVINPVKLIFDKLMEISKMIQIKNPQKHRQDK